MVRDTGEGRVPERRQELCTEHGRDDIVCDRLLTHAEPNLEGTIEVLGDLKRCAQAHRHEVQRRRFDKGIDLDSVLGAFAEQTVELVHFLLQGSVWET